MTTSCTSRSTDAGGAGHERADLRPALAGCANSCLLAAEAGLFELVLAEPILTELREKLITKFRNSDEEADAVLAGLRGSSVLVALSGQTGWVEADPDDDKFIEAAIVADADVIVSGDRHLLQVNALQGIPIVKPREFLDRIIAADE